MLQLKTNLTAAWSWNGTWLWSWWWSWDAAWITWGWWWSWAWSLSCHLTCGSLDLWRLSVVVDDDALSLQVLNTLGVNVVDLDNVVGVVVVVVVLLGDDSLCVQVVSVDSCNDCLVMLMMDVVLNDECLACGKVLLDLLVDNYLLVDDPSWPWSWDWWRQDARVVKSWQSSLWWSWLVWWVSTWWSVGASGQDNNWALWTALANTWCAHFELSWGLVGWKRMYWLFIYKYNLIWVRIVKHRLIL